MDFKLLNRNNRIIILILLFLLGIFMIEYPERVKNKISNVYKKKLAAAASKLQENQVKQVEDELKAFERGTVISEKKSRHKGFHAPGLFHRTLEKMDEFLYHLGQSPRLLLFPVYPGYPQKRS